MIELVNVSKYFPTASGRHYLFRNVSLRLPRRQNIGVIGPNGGGKSTFLRLLSGSELPSEGKVIRTGKISWPLGLTPGLQNDMTAIENTRFAARIYGMTSREIKATIDRVRDIAEIGKYFDMPVRTYSAGMKQRVSFALSMSLDFNYYLFDEISAGGDARFRAKANALIEERLSRANFIVVTHNHKEVEELCQSAILIGDGQLIYFDNVPDAIAAYGERYGKAETARERKQAARRETIEAIQKGLGERDPPPLTAVPAAAPQAAAEAALEVRAEAKARKAEERAARAARTASGREQARLATQAMIAEKRQAQQAERAEKQHQEAARKQAQAAARAAREAKRKAQAEKRTEKAKEVAARQAQRAARDEQRGARQAARAAKLESKAKPPETALDKMAARHGEVRAQLEQLRKRRGGADAPPPGVPAVAPGTAPRAPSVPLKRNPAPKPAAKPARTPLPAILRAEIAALAGKLAAPDLPRAETRQLRHDLRAARQRLRDLAAARRGKTPNAATPEPATAVIDPSDV